MTADFNADTRGTELQNRNIVIDGTKYKPAKRTNQVMREFRRVAREDTKLERQQHEAARKLADLNQTVLEQRRDGTVGMLAGMPDETPQSVRDRLAAEYAAFCRKIDDLAARDPEEVEAERETLESELDELEEGRERAIFQMIAVLLAPRSNGQPIDAESIREKLDVELAGDLMEYLTPKGDEPDPTPARSSSSD